MNKVIFILILLCWSCCSSAADILLMPRELVDVAKENGCKPVTGFFNRYGMVDPPFVYGYLAGDKESSAVFWCESERSNEAKYQLILMSKSNDRATKCPAKFAWRNFPGGLSLVTKAEFSLAEFHYVDDEKKAGPSETIKSDILILSYYDGISDYFYCYQGRWLYRAED